MFIKLTQLNGKPIWFNQQYIVTVEPRKGSGALVVPLGDGLDYEVLESPGAIIDAMGGAMSPTGKPVAETTVPSTVAVPKPAIAEEPDFRIESGLIVPVKTTPPKENPAEKAQVPDTDKKPKPDTQEEPPKKTAAKRPRKTSASHKTASATKDAEEKPAATSANAAEEKPPAKVVKATPAKEKTAKKAHTTTRKAATAKKKAAMPPLPLTEDQLTRLQKMSPGSMRKLVNTLMSQFAVAETTAVVDALCVHGIISVTDQGHVDWNWRKQK